MLSTKTIKIGRSLHTLAGIGAMCVLAANVAPAQDQERSDQERSKQERPEQGSAAKTAHLEIARQLARDLQHDALINTYGSNPTFIRWGTPTREARTVCATFVTRVFERAYGWKKKDIQRWLGANGADASDWHAVIVQEKGFWRLQSIRDVKPGDILAIKYNDGSKDTGHIMIVDEEPQRLAATPPVESGTEQYGVEVLDSSASGHGPDDSRHKADGGFTGGIGKGTVRLYVNRAGSLVGYAWSQTKKSKFYHSPERDLVAGRLTRKVCDAEPEQNPVSH